MMASQTRSSGGRYQPDSRRLPLGTGPPTGVSYRAACRSERTSAPPAENALRAQRNYLSLRSVERSEPPPTGRPVEVPEHLAVLQKSFAFRAAFGPALAARRGPLFHSASSESNQAA